MVDLGLVLLLREVEVRVKNIRYWAVVVAVSDLVADDESHDLVRVLEVLNRRVLHLVRQCDVLTADPGEVYDDLITLAHGNGQIVCLNWVTEVTRVGGDDLEIEPVTVFVDKVQVVRATDRHVVDSEAIFTRFDLEERPRLFVDLDELAEKVEFFIFESQ